MSWLVAGVDEAGLGPLLGPLTIGYSVLEIPEAGATPWKLCRQTITDDPKQDATKLVVTDSKRVHARNDRGRRRLERTALAFDALLREGGRPARAAREFLFGTLQPKKEHLAGSPWYESLPTIPRFNDVGGLELATARLERSLRESGFALLDAGVRVIPAAELNASFRETNNKASTVWAHVVEVLRSLWGCHADGEHGLDVTVDLLGGRRHYGPHLARAFQGAGVRMLAEGKGHASYELEERRGPRRMRVTFQEKGDVHSFCVALASCFAKYARETVMEGFNGYFAGLAPGLTPTAGYTTDGRRWLRDAEGALSRAGLERRVLVRER